MWALLQSVLRSLVGAMRGGLLIMTCALSCTLSCTGQISGPIPAPVKPAVLDGPRTCRPVSAPMRALTARQYDVVVEDLLADTTRPAQVLERPSSESRFDNHAEWVGMDEVRLRFYLRSAETLANSAVTRQATLFPCSRPPMAQEEACVGQIIDTFGRRAMRRTLTTDERDNLLAAFRAVRALPTATWDEALSAVLQVILQSPQFLYVTEVGTAVDGAARPTSKLTPLEVATKLSLFLWGSVPDVALLDAAEQGRLITAEDVTRETRRMLADPRARTGYLHFADQWLELDVTPGVIKNPTLFPAWTAALANASRDELQAFAADTFTTGKTYAQLMTDRSTSATGALASVYEVTGPTLPDARAGVLTRVAWLATHAHPEQTSPTLRGKAIRTRMLCEEISPPPPGVDVMLPNVTGPATLRQKLAVHMMAGTTCYSCHSLMDPLGFGLEGFDAMGSARTTESNGLAIDSTGEINPGVASGSFTNAAGLSQRLAELPAANRCYLTQVYRYAQGRTESSKDRCHLDAAFASLQAGASLQEVVVAVTTSDAFLYRESLP